MGVQIPMRRDNFYSRGLESPGIPDDIAASRAKAAEPIEMPFGL